jgi:hypothetical protein
MSRSFPAPDFIKTARGGKRSAIIIKTNLLSITLSWNGENVCFFSGFHDRSNTVIRLYSKPPVATLEPVVGFATVKN